jgi:hypothetical protein
MAKEAFTFRCVGRNVRCHKCNAVISVPQPPTEEPPAEPEAAAMAPATADTAVRTPTVHARRGGAGIEIEELFSTVGRWIGEGFRIATANFGTLYFGVLMVLILSVECLAIGLIPFSLLFPAIALDLLTGKVALLAVPAALTRGFGLSIVPFAILAPALVGGVVILLVDVTRSREASSWAVFSGFVNKCYWRSVGAVWLWLAAMLAAAIPSVAVSATVFATTAPSGGAGVALGVIVSVILWLAVLYLSSRIIWVLPLALDQRLPVGESFRRSWRMTERIAEGWGLFVLVFVLKIMGIVLAAVVATVATGAWQLFSRATKNAAAPVLAAALVTVLLLPIIYTLLLPSVFVAYRESVPH